MLRDTHHDPHTIVTQLTRFTIDPKTDDLKLSEPEILHTGNSEFYRIDDRMMLRGTFTLML